MLIKTLTPDNIEWLFTEAMAQQGCLHGDECDENRELLRQMETEFKRVLEVVTAGKDRDHKVIEVFLSQRGLALKES